MAKAGLLRTALGWLLDRGAEGVYQEHIVETAWQKVKAALPAIFGGGAMTAILARLVENWVVAIAGGILGFVILIYATAIIRVCRMGKVSSQSRHPALLPEEIIHAPSLSTPFKETVPDGRGGRGGGGNALGEASLVVGGTGGQGGSPGCPRGGDGGGGDAVGRRAMVIGGDGGDAGRFDGRGGKGAASPFSQMSQEWLRSWGLTGREGFGRGGDGGNSPEYDRRLRIAGSLSAQYVADHPNDRMVPMPGVLMPPVAWINERLVERKENFYIELIDNGRDFVFQTHKKT